MLFVLRRAHVGMWRPHELAPGSLLLVLCQGVGTMVGRCEVDPLRACRHHVQAALVEHEALERVPEFWVRAAIAQLAAILLMQVARVEIDPCLRGLLQLRLRQAFLDLARAPRAVRFEIHPEQMKHEFLHTGCESARHPPLHRAQSSQHLLHAGHARLALGVLQGFPHSPGV